MIIYTMDNRFCVYEHVRSDTNLVFYVGKGLANRPHEKIKRNRYWDRIVNKVGYTVKIVKDGLTEDQAFKLEEILIKTYQKLKMCEANLLIGDQRRGATWSDDERRSKASERWKLNNPIKKGNIPWNKNKKGVQKAWNIGLTWGPETRAKISKSNKDKVAWNKGIPTSEEAMLKYVTSRGCQPFKAINLKTEKIEWQGLLQTECIKFFNWNSSCKGNLNSCLKGHRKFHKGYRFEYLEVQND